MKKTRLTLLALTLGIFASCEKKETNDELDTVQAVKAPAVEFRNLKNNTFKVNSPSKTKMNVDSRSVTLFSAEYITIEDGEEIGNTIFFVDRGNKMLSADFVPIPDYTFDGNTDISYYIDQNRPTDDLDIATSTAAISRSMDTWKNVNCSDLGLYEVEFDSGRNAGLYAYIVGVLSGNEDFGGSLTYTAEVYHGGWLSGDFFEFLRAGGAESILGVTLTYTLTDANGDLIDVDSNGKADVGFREIYYNEEFTWGDNDRTKYDVETVALHEAGHGLSQAHFGQAFRTGSNEKIHFSPRAVMNAAYSGIQTNIGKTDNAGHCANWDEWPNL